MTDPVDLPNETRPIEYPFSEWQIKLQEAILKLKGRPRHCAVNSIRGLKRAWLIADIDPEIAYFRALTAEEEAATALIFALKHRRYPGAEKLDYNYHPHKAGLAPFLGAIETVFAESNLPIPSVKLDYESTPPRIEVSFAAEAFGMPSGYKMSPDEPLNGVFSVGDSSDPSANVFDEALERYARSKGSDSVVKAIQEEANLRNRLLYAADNGIIKVERVDFVLIAKSRPITLMLTLAVAILQTRKHQLLPAQALESYLRIFDRAPDKRFDYAAAIGPPPAVKIQVEFDKNNKPVAKIQRTVSFAVNFNIKNSSAENSQIARTNLDQLGDHPSQIKKGGALWPRPSKPV